jgi:uncharacterized 2Fe-2S/4Fe-4S cluster protein (DUF4445 family)
MSTPGEDAQRELERRALRNVRGLVDKMENTDELDRRSIRKTVVVIAAVMAVLFAAAYGAYLARGKSEPPRTVVIPPPANAAK